MCAADMPKNALSVLLTAVQPDNYRTVKRQKINNPPEEKQSHINEAQPQAGLSNDPSEVCAWIPCLGIIAWHTRPPDAASGCFRIMLKSLTLQAANLLRKQFHIRVKGRSVPSPLQVCACHTLSMLFNDRSCPPAHPCHGCLTASKLAAAIVRRSSRLCGRTGNSMRGCSRT